MRITHSGRLLTAGVLACGLNGFTPRPAPAQVLDIGEHHKMPVTAVGCLEREKDYRNEQGRPEGGFLNTGKGDGDEYVLVDARIGGPSMDIAVTEAESRCASRRGGQAFELTGHGEPDLESLVGRRVVISGELKHAKHDTGPVGTSGEFIPNPRDGGANLSGGDLELREINVDAFRLAPVLAEVPPAAETAIAPEEPLPAPAPVAIEPAPQPAAPEPALPKTASPLPTIGVFGLLSFACAIGVRLFNRARCA